MRKIRSLWISIAALAGAVLLLAGVSAVPAQAAGKTAVAKAPDCAITYHFPTGDYTVTPELAMTMMIKDAKGQYAIDPNTHYYMLDAKQMQEFFSGLQAMFPPAGAVNGFKTTRGDVISIGQNLQNAGYLDVDAEIAYLSLAIMEQRHEVHQPILTAGGTYVEIDLTNQKLYYYENGQQRFATDIVTGNASKGMNTPTGVYSLRAKQRDVSLVGQSYVSFVKYWCPFIRNSVGIHDAGWRSKFGGQIYQTNGSHGCVNVPPAVMPALYDMLQVGVPVVVFN